MSKSGFGKSSVGRKVVMALSGMFLLIFLLQHLIINALSVISPEAFNEASHFMGTNPVVQFLAQPILIAGILIHYVMGIALTIRNKKARPIAYVSDNQAANSSWVSRNMVVTGIVIFLFLILHMGQFWLHEIQVKFIGGDWEGLNEAGNLRYWGELNAKFNGEIVYAVVYTVAFIFLGLHLSHGFASTFQSVGFRNKSYTPGLEKFGKIYSILVPACFIAIAWYHTFCSGTCGA